MHLSIECSKVLKKVQSCIYRGELVNRMGDLEIRSVSRRLPDNLSILDIIDPTTTVSADSSQGNEALFGVNTGRQCKAMSLTAIIYYQIQGISLWTNSTLSNILVIRNIHTVQ